MRSWVAAIARGSTPDAIVQRPKTTPIEGLERYRRSNKARSAPLCFVRLALKHSPARLTAMSCKVRVRICMPGEGFRGPQLLRVNEYLAVLDDAAFRAASEGSVSM